MGNYLVLLLAGLFCSTIALAETYTFSSVEPNPFSVQAKDKDLEYTVTINGNRLSLKSSQLGSMLKYMKVSSPEKLKGKSFSSSHSVTELALDEFRLQSLNNGHYVPPSSDQFFDKIVKGLVENKPLKCPNAQDLADNATLTKILKEVYVKDCGSLNPATFKKLKDKLENQSKGTMSLTISPIKDIDGWGASCGEYFDIVKDGVPVAKLHLEGAANGFQCSTDPKTLSAEPSLKTSSSSTAKKSTGNK